MAKRRSITGQGARDKKKLQQQKRRQAKALADTSKAAASLTVEGTGVTPKKQARMQPPLREEMHPALKLSQGSLTVLADLAPSTDSPNGVCTPPRVPELGCSAGQAQPPLGEEINHALRLSSPQGSLTVLADLAPSTDSPNGVCTPPRVPELGCSAGQAQLLPWLEENSTLKKDGMHKLMKTTDETGFDAHNDNISHNETGYELNNESNLKTCKSSCKATIKNNAKITAKKAYSTSMRTKRGTVQNQTKSKVTAKNELKPNHKTQKGPIDKVFSIREKNDTEIVKNFQASNVSKESKVLTEDNTSNQGGICLERDDVVYLGSEMKQLSFLSLSSSEKANLCKKLCIPSPDTTMLNTQLLEQPIAPPRKIVEIEKDGNCFFRAVSQSLTSTQNHHVAIRTAICKHLIENDSLFHPLLRHARDTVPNYLSWSKMERNGSWATEVEIIALAHLLKTKIYVYSNKTWVTFSPQLVDEAITLECLGGIYLHHANQNHYELVTSVFDDQSSVAVKHNKKILKRLETRIKRCVNTVQKTIKKGNSKALLAEKKRKKYGQNANYRKKVKQQIRTKYLKDFEYRLKVKQNSKSKYACQFVKNLKKKKSIEKYKKDQRHRIRVKHLSAMKYQNNRVHRENVKQRSVQKYKTNVEHKEHVKQISILRYRMNESHQETLKVSLKNKYQSNVQEQKKKINDVSVRRKAQKDSLKSQENVLNLFKGKSKEGPDYTCCCCHRLLFYNQVQRCASKMYEKHKCSEIAKICLNDKYEHTCKSCSPSCRKSGKWICFTCQKKILSGNLPAESVANKMFLENIPSELDVLNTLEQHLVALHIPFMKVLSLPQGGQQNVHGPVVCVPSDLKKATSLPLPCDDTNVLRVKLKRKLCYKGHHEYQFVNPNHLKAAINYLKNNNKWYADIEINQTWEEEYNKSELCEGEECKKGGEDEYDETNEIAIDTCLQPVDIAQDVLDHYFDDVFNLAPAEGKNPVRMLQEKGNEAKTFPHLFPTGNFAWGEDREEKITLARYFNNRLMNTDNRFAKDTNYIFFCQYMSELNQVIEKTQISLRKSASIGEKGKPVTAEMLQDPDVLRKLLRNDEAIRFMQPIRGTPAYWSATQKDLFAMLRQLGIPTWFCSFSAAEYRWTEIGNIILQQENDERNFADLDWKDKSEILKKNPVTVARMFEHRFHVFQKDVILSPSNPIGNVVDYFVRVEFQQRGSPHMHCLYWVENTPKVGIDSDDDICKFVDKYVSCGIPSEEDDPELRQIVLDVQQHSKNHSKSCKKKGTECRFNFPRPPSTRTFITKHDKPDDSNDDLARKQATNILERVWNEVIKEENENKSVEELFENICVSQEMFEKAHQVLATKTSTILRRNLNEMWTNQYNPCLLKCWDANMDIQFVLDPFSCIVYIISYISKSEREMGMLLKQTQVEAREGNLSAQQTIKRIGSAYLNHREVSCQEAVYRVCNLKMKESSRKVVFIPVGENPTRLSKPLALMKVKQFDRDMEDDGENEDDSIWMTNIVERYENRPETNEFHQMCLAEFCSKYRVLAKSQIPKTEKEGVYELRNGKGYIRLRTKTKPAVVRYPRFKQEDAEKYYQSLLQLFLPYWNLQQLKPGKYESYKSFYETGHIKPSQTLKAVKEIIDNNYRVYSENAEALDAAQETYDAIGEPEDAWANLCPESEKSRQECIEKKKILKSEDDKKPEVTKEVENEGLSDILYTIREPNKLRKDILPILQSLNTKQKQLFYVMHDWCIQRMTQTNIEPLYIFVTGGAGTGKSHLIKAIHYEVSRLFERTLNTPDSVSVVLTAFTGTAAFNIGGNTIHHVFSLNKALPLPYEPLKEQTLNTLRTKLEDLKVLVIDEVSMVYKKLLYYIHQRLVQIKKCKEPFGGVSIIAFGDFYQLPPVKQRKDERLYQQNFTYPVDYWLDYFKLVELDEVMRQREDKEFAMILNFIRSRSSTEPMSNAAKSLLHDCIRVGPDDALHVYATNAEANDFNNKMLKNHCEDLVQLDAKDYVKDRTTGKIKHLENPLTLTTDCLSKSILLAEKARVMLTRNIDVDDGLVNGVMGHVLHFDYKSDNQIKEIQAIGILFDSKKVGKKTGKLTSKGIVVQIKRMEEEIREKNKKNVVRHQFPLKLSWACTAHKVQGMTTDKVVVNIDKTFSAGQAYVAFSRVTSKEGLFIETDNEEKLIKKIYADPDVKLALESMSELKLTEEYMDCNKVKSFILFNVQSLKGHFQDILRDDRFLQVDFICLTETWLKPDSDTQDVQLPDFDFFHNSRKQCYDNSDEEYEKLSTAKGGGVGLYKNKRVENMSITPLKHKNIEVLAIEVDSETLILLVYRPSTLSVQKFLKNLGNIVDFFNLQYSKLIVMGDINENAYTSGPIKTYLESKGFTQKVDFYTTEASTMIDHVYTTQNIDVRIKRMPVYFSFHEAILINF